MFWDRVAGVYDIFANVINKKTHDSLKKVVARQIGESDDVLECACGTGLLTAVIAPRCRSLVATDFSAKMLKRAEKNCAAYGNVTFQKADILSLPFADGTFDTVVAANVIHLLDEPKKAMRELDRVCRSGGTLIVPTYMNQDSEGRTSRFAETVGKAGADFKREFTFSTYPDFFRELGYADAEITAVEGRVPCAVAVIRKRG